MEAVQLFADLVAVQVALFDAVDARLRREAGLMLIEFLPLRVVATTPDCRVQDLSTVLGISPGGASKSVDRMEREGLVQRRPNQKDRRSSVLSPTARGRQALATAEPLVADEMARRVIGIVGREDAARLASTLATLHQASIT